MIRHALLGTALVLAMGCDKKNETTTTSATQTASTVTAKANDTAKPVEKTEDKPKKMEPVLTFKNLSTPESVLYDDVADVYLVSNIDGKPLAADGKGWISKLKPDGTVENEKWIEGGKNKVTLNAPKGMAFANDMLYVADLDTVRMFDRKSGEPKGEVKIPNTTFLNDIAATPDGSVVVTETGMKAGTTKDFEPTGNDAVYMIDKNKKLTTVAKSKDLGNPNGILAKDGKYWVVSFGSGELYSLDSKGTKADVKKLPKGTLDGIVMLPDGDLLISSWDSKSIWRGKPGGDFKEIIGDVKSPADIGWDTKRSRLLVPLFEENEVRVYDVK